MATKVNYTLWAAAFVLMCLIAPVKLALGAVPVTLQTFAIFTTAVLLGPRFALLSTLGYLLLGAMGLPIFGNFSAGYSKLYGPTAGFLWGFIPTAVYAAWDAQRRERHFFNVMGTLLRAHVLLLVVGFAVLYLKVEGLQMWGTLVRLLPGLLLKILLGGGLVSWLYPKLSER